MARGIVIAATGQLPALLFHGPRGDTLRVVHEQLGGEVAHECRVSIDVEAFDGGIREDDLHRKVVPFPEQMGESIFVLLGRKATNHPRTGRITVRERLSGL